MPNPVFSLENYLDVARTEGLEATIALSTPLDLASQILLTQPALDKKKQEDNIFCGTYTPNTQETGSIFDAFVRSQAQTYQINRIPITKKLLLLHWTNSGATAPSWMLLAIDSGRRKQVLCVAHDRSAAKKFNRLFTKEKYREIIFSVGTESDRLQILIRLLATSMWEFKEFEPIEATEPPPLELLSSSQTTENHATATGLQFFNFTMDDALAELAKENSFMKEYEEHTFTLVDPALEQAQQQKKA